MAENLWKPTEEQIKYLKLIISMSVDCSLGKGTADVTEYLTNLQSAIYLFPTTDNGG